MKNQYINTKKAIDIGNQAWDRAYDAGLLNISISHAGDSRLRSASGHEFINMCSCSYLGLDVHPDIIQGAVDCLKRAGTLNLPTSRVRIRLSELDDVEQDLSELYRAEAVVTMSCGSATSGILPILASGYLTNGQKPVMLFDRHAHFSMNHIKPICGDETEVITTPHNDVNFIEDVCKKNKVVAYVADGAYSMGGATPIEELLELQEKYGLFLYFDDSHSLSAYGDKGQGIVYSNLKELSDRTIIVYSLAKGFGACGGMVLLGSKSNRHVIDRFGGPMSWSQYINPASIGSIKASAKIHRTQELNERQIKLYSNIRLFDQLIDTENSGTTLPIRVIILNEAERAIECSKYIYENGFYTSAVFFPVVAKGKAGLRVMIRADLDENDIRRFCKVVNQAIAMF